MQYRWPLTSTSRISDDTPPGNKGAPAACAARISDGKLPGGFVDVVVALIGNNQEDEVLITDSAESCCEGF